MTVKDTIPQTELERRAWSAACYEAQAAYDAAAGPERTATAEELAAERVRIDLLSGGQTPPRTLHALCEQAIVLVPCGQCWAPSGTPCSRGGSVPGYEALEETVVRRRLATARLRCSIRAGMRHVADPGPTWRTRREQAAHIEFHAGLDEKEASQ